jgi:hypothetical protein
VTREHPKIDRIACPWLISRFINPEAEFIYVPAKEVSKVAADVGGTPYDIDGIQFGHVGDRFSFDPIVDAYCIQDPHLKIRIFSDGCVSATTKQQQTKNLIFALMRGRALAAWQQLCAVPTRRDLI